MFYAKSRKKRMTLA